MFCDTRTNPVQPEADGNVTSFIYSNLPKAQEEFIWPLYGTGKTQQSSSRNKKTGDPIFPRNLLPLSSMWKAQVKLHLTETQRRMYAAEKQENFRWISKLVATYSEYKLSDKDLVDESEAAWVQEIGQFAEVVYSALPLESLIGDYDIMKQPGFPLEGYDALSPDRPLPTPVPQTQLRVHPPATSSGVQVVKSFKGSVASLPAAVFSRWIHEHETLKHSYTSQLGLFPNSSCSSSDIKQDGQDHVKKETTGLRRHQQVIVSICGTTSISQVLHDLRANRRPYPGASARGAAVHNGFWDMYQGIKPQLLEGIREAVKLDPPSDEQEPGQPRAEDSVPSPSGTPREEGKVLRELVVTGHSMGGAMAHLLSIDLLSIIPTPPGSTSPVPSTPHTLENASNTEDTSYLRQFGFKSLQIVTFGEPRAGNQDLVDHWRVLKAQHGKEYNSLIREWCVKGYNDGVPALPPVKIGYRHFTEEPLYTVDGQLYRVPPNENEHALFHVTPPAGPDTGASDKTVPSPPSPSYPLGGHNYYNERDLEGFLRRIEWLDKAGYPREGWENRYRDFLKTHLGEPGGEVRGKVAT